MPEIPNIKLELVNTVAGGKIDSEVDLQVLKKDISFDTCFISGPGLYFKFNEKSPTIVLARSGKYFFTGAQSLSEIKNTRNKTLNFFLDLGLISSINDNGFSIKNMVFTADLDCYIDLSNLCVKLGLESVEYEPEQFPGLIFRPDECECVLLIFSSGKVVITGSTKKKTAEIAMEELLDTLDGYDS
jgi:transcription initiation factor TFIID TATA-box-binding protein